MHTILVPIDGSDHSFKALHIACDIAEKYSGRIALLYVLVDGKPADKLLGLTSAKKFTSSLMKTLAEQADQSPGHTSLETLKEVGESVLSQAENRVHYRGIDVHQLRMEYGNPVDHILMACERTRANTIVMGSRGVSRSTSSPFGSISNSVFAKAECTCISVK